MSDEENDSCPTLTDTSTPKERMTDTLESVDVVKSDPQPQCGDNDELTPDYTVVSAEEESGLEFPSAGATAEDATISVDESIITNGTENHHYTSSDDDTVSIHDSQGSSHSSQSYEPVVNSVSTGGEEKESFVIEMSGGADVDVPTASVNGNHRQDTQDDSDDDTQGKIDFRAMRAQKGFNKMFQPLQEKCPRCDKVVYPVDRIPFNESVYHKYCFRCAECETVLNKNTAVAAARDIYCNKHKPALKSHYGQDARALAHEVTQQKKVSSDKKDQMKGLGQLKGTDPGKAGHLDTDSKLISGPLNAPKIGTKTAYDGQYTLDIDALFIRNPMLRQLLMKHGTPDDLSKHSFPALLIRTKEDFYGKQEELERKQREEEERLLKELLERRAVEDEKQQKEFGLEWESRLHDLVGNFEKKTKGRKLKDSELKAMTVKLEQDKKQLEDELERKKKEEAARLREEEQEQTAELVKKHADEQRAEREKFVDEVTAEVNQELIENELDQELSSEQLLDQLGVGIRKEIPPPHPPSCPKSDLFKDVDEFEDLDNYVISIAEDEQETFTELVRKLTERSLTDLQKVRAIFRWITVKDLNVMEFNDIMGVGDTPMGLLRGIKFGTETYHVLFMRLCSYAGLHCVEIKGHSKSVGYEPGKRFQEGSFHNTWNAVLIDEDWRLIQCNWGARHLVLNKDKQHQQQQQRKEKDKKDKIRYQYDEHYFLTDPDKFIMEFWPFAQEWQLLEKPITLREFEELPFVRSVFFHYGMKFEKKTTAVLTASDSGGAEVRINLDREMARDVVFHYQLKFANPQLAARQEIDGAKLDRYVFQGMFNQQVLYNIYVPTAGEYFLEVFANRIEIAPRGSQDTPMQPFRLKCACKFKIVCHRLNNKMHPLPDCAAGEWGPAKAKRHFGLDPITHKIGVINPPGSELCVKFRESQPLRYVVKLRKNKTADREMEKILQYKVHEGELTIKARFTKSGQYGMDIYAHPVHSNAEDSQTLAHACKYLINVGEINPAKGDRRRSSGGGNGDDFSEKPLPPAPGDETRGRSPSDRGSRHSSSDDNIEFKDKPLPAPPPAQTTAAAATASPPPPAPKILKEKLGAQPIFRKMGLKTLTHRDPKVLLRDNFFTIEIGLTEPLFVTFQLLSDPELNDLGSLVKVSQGERKLIFRCELKEPGFYILALFARRPEDGSNDMLNVYNYSIRYGIKDKGRKSILKK